MEDGNFVFVGVTGVVGEKRPFVLKSLEQTVMITIAEEYIQEGRLEAKRQIARRLLKLHDVVTISELTGLSLEEVKALQETQDEE